MKKTKKKYLSIMQKNMNQIKKYNNKAKIKKINVIKTKSKIKELKNIDNNLKNKRS